MKPTWIIVCFLNFFIASVMGVVLRGMSVFPLEHINYQFLLHGHSHVAMLGWVYLMLYSLIIAFFLPKESQEKKIYSQLFWITEIAVIGMMIDFPAQGYAFISILFSTLHLFCSYFFGYLIYKEKLIASSAEKKLLHTALAFLVLSTLGVWCLGPAVGLMGKSSIFYQIAIQFFLHFQFNGWFILAILALFFHQAKLRIAQDKFQKLYYLLILSTVLSFALPLSWFIKNEVLYWVNLLSVGMQCMAAGLFILQFHPQLTAFLKSKKGLEKRVYGLALLSLSIKICLQLSAFFPDFIARSHTIRSFIIGYIHLTMLGIITSFLFGFLLQNKVGPGKKAWQNWGLHCFLLGFVATEILLLFQGIYHIYQLGIFPYYPQNLFIFSLFLPLGLFLWILGSVKQKPNKL
ncbi:MAG: hypothetical protein ACRC6O_02955 [Flavobacterium sp.]